MTQVKICGLSEPASVDAALAAGADHVGFVFFPRSPRNVTPEIAGVLARCVPLAVGRVGVFVAPDDTMLDAAVAGLSAIQLHNVEPARAGAVRERYRLPVWAAVAVRGPADIIAARAFRDAADRLLFDAKPVEAGALPGGNGLRFDWRVLSGINVGMDWVLSGGLDADSVGEAIQTTGAPAVDVSSGVEDEPGVKSVAKIAAFVEAVRAS